jgi:DNA-binding FadR family transcriptional regulator
MRSPGLRCEEFNELDTEFHVSIARASKNALATDLMQALRDAVKHKMTAVFANLTDWRAVAEQLVREHEHVLRAIAHNEPDSAAKLISEHIEGFYRDQLFKGDN